MFKPRNITSGELLPLYWQQSCVPFYPLPCLGPGEGPTPFPSSAEMCRSRDRQGMQPGPTPLFLPTLCPAGLLGVPPRKGQSRTEVTCDLEPREKCEGETWGCSALQEENRRSWCTVQPCAMFATTRWYCPGAGLLREMDESSQSLGWVSPWREPAGLLWRCIWNYNATCIMWTLCHGALQTYLNLHNPLKTALSFKYFFWLQSVLSKSLFLFTSGNRPVLSLAVALWPTKLALFSSNSPAVRSAPSPWQLTPN